MNIFRFSNLIANLPVRQQCFTTRKSTWQNFENQTSWLRAINEHLFEENNSLVMSRNDVFNTENVREKIIKTIYWGYPRGMRGNNFTNIINQIDIIQTTIIGVLENRNRTTQDFFQLANSFGRIQGIGLSTYSKLLYFFDIRFNNLPSLILDQRLIDVFKRNIFENFQHLNNINYTNAENFYMDYLKTINVTSENLGCREENIEQFLFMFGNNIKEI